MSITDRAIRPADRVLPLLQQVRAVTDREWWACCPIHEADGRAHEPSLHITEAPDGRLLFFCHVCRESASAAQMVHALGLTLSELYPPREREERTGGGGKKSKRPRGKPTAEYIYRDEDGALLFKVCRFESQELKDDSGKPKKTFIQARPDGEGGWVWNTKGVRKVPYRLPELLKADPAQVVFVVEGEKKADALADWGQVATCNAGGAGKWLASFTRYFIGRQVVILPDNDPPNPHTGLRAGLEHAATVAELLRPVAASVITIELPGLPPKGDVVDWIAAGGTLAELLQLVETATAAALETQAVPPAEPPQPPAGDVKADAAMPEEIANAVEIEGETIPLCMEQILSRITKATDGWPRRVGPVLFVHEQRANGQSVDWLTSAADLFGFLGSRSGRPAKIHRTMGCHTKEEIFGELSRHTTAYDSVETFPHEPSLPRHYYACETPEPGNGDALIGLVQKFRPESPLDFDLITAFVCTLFWGGPGGTRPAFVITSGDGRGSGKTRLAMMISRLAGDFIEVSGREDIETIKTRLLSVEGLAKRVALIDNVKSLRFSWAELEALITSPIVSGRKLYAGEGVRPNTLTWVLTLNGISLSTDMAQRSVIIRIRKPKHNGDWERDVTEYIEANRREIIADTIGFLRKPEVKLENYSRWGLWERCVLSKFPSAPDLQKLIVDRQAASNVEEEEAEIIEDFFSSQLKSLGYNPEADRVFLPNRICCEWLTRALNEKVTTSAATRMIKQKIAEGAVHCLQECGRHWGRGVLWVGDAFDPEETVRTDIEHAIERANGNSKNYF